MHQGRGHGARAVSRREGAVDERGRQGSRQAAERRLGDERGCVHRAAPALPLQRIAWRDETEREAVMANERIFRVRELRAARDVFVLAFQAAKQFAEPFEIVLRPLKAKRSADQNRRYWALLREVAAAVWIEVAEHEDGP